MAKRIRIRRALGVAAVAGVLGLVMIAPAQAYVPTDKGLDSTGCNASSRMLHNEPDMCSQVTFADAPATASTPTPVSSSSSTVPWIAYPALGLLIVAAIGAAIRNHPQAVS